MLPEEVAALFGVRPDTVKVWARNRPEWIGAVKPGGEWRFLPERVDAAVRETRAGQTCPFDTNGDGDCGQPLCPFCGGGPHARAS
jgi:hypothetical protein